MKVKPLYAFHKQHGRIKSIAGIAAVIALVFLFIIWLPPSIYPNSVERLVRRAGLSIAEKTAVFLANSSEWYLDIANLFSVAFPPVFSNTVAMFHKIEDTQVTGITSKQASVYGEKYHVYLMRMAPNLYYSLAEIGGHYWLTNYTPPFSSLESDPLLSVATRTEVALNSNCFIVSCWRGTVTKCANGSLLLMMPRNSYLIFRYSLPPWFLPRSFTALPGLAYVRWTSSDRSRYVLNTFPFWHQTNAAGVVVASRGAYRVTPSSREREEQRGSRNLYYVVIIVVIFTGISIRSVIVWVRNEREYMMHQRLIAVGELAAGVAHEVRNPLNAVSLTIQQLLSDTKLAEQFPQYPTMLAMSCDEINRANNTLTDFLQYARPPKLEYRKSSINSLCENVVYIMQAIADIQKISIVRVFDDLPEIAIDHELVHQALINVSLNAIQAMPAGGVIQYKTHLRRYTIEIEITDTGCGISPRDRDKIFDFYYTTKHKGLGLGLPFVYRVVSLHGGRVSIMDNEPHGTRIILIFPLKYKLFSPNTHG